MPKFQSLGKIFQKEKIVIRRIVFLLFYASLCISWGFFAHKNIHVEAAKKCPPALGFFLLKHEDRLREAAVNADRRKFADKLEGPKHYIDLEFFGDNSLGKIQWPWDSLCAHYGKEDFMKNGTLPWEIRRVYYQLVKAFAEGNPDKTFKLLGDLGHYVSDACVPLHTTENYNGQLTDQKGIHGLWESDIPERYADSWKLNRKKAKYCSNVWAYTLKLIATSHAEVEKTLEVEKQLRLEFPEEQRMVYSKRKKQYTKRFHARYIEAYNQRLKGQVEDQYQRSIQAVADLWFSAWVDAGQPNTHDWQLN